MGETRLYSVSNALLALNKEYTGQIHRAVSDAENTAIIVQEAMSIYWKEYFEKFEEESKRKNNRK